MGFRSTSLIALVCCVFCCIAAAVAQVPDEEPNSAGAPVPVITFDLNFPGATPPHYAVSVESTCRASYRSDQGSETGDHQPYTTEFTMSEGVCRQIFALAKQANYFHGDFDYHPGRIANTGAKTLTYAEGPQSQALKNPTNGRNNKTTFNYSQNPAIQQVASIFQRISTTLEFGDRLQREHRFDRMSLEGELKRMEEMQKSHDLLEVQAIGPVLREIANDSAIFNVTRQRAIRLLRVGSAEVAEK